MIFFACAGPMPGSSSKRAAVALFKSSFAGAFDSAAPACRNTLLTSIAPMNAASAISRNTDDSLITKPPFKMDLFRRAETPALGSRFRVQRLKRFC